MKDIIVKAFIFAAGAALGSVVTYKTIKNQYEERIAIEAEEIRDMYEKKYKDTDECVPDSNEYDEEPTKAAVQDNHTKNISVAEYAAKLADLKYTDYSGSGKDDEEEQESETIKAEKRVKELNDSKPYTISPDEFGEKDGYDVVCLMYFADGFLADDDDSLVPDVEEVVGWENLNAFGEYDDDVVYVRNDYLQIDYEISRSELKYKEYLEDMEE